MSPILFWIFSALMLGFGLAVIVNRNPVASALSLVMSFLGLAALFISLDAYFLGIIQVLVYAGAVMVLFLFIIMLLDLGPTQRRPWNVPALIGGVAVAGAFAVVVSTVIHRFPAGNKPFEPLHDKLTDAHNIGMTLFGGYNLPFQVIGVLILVATIGVVVLSKRELK
ncbi:MAG: NADH-quinone oxidoreductase subunit J [Verrucomicrobiota bacterium]